MLSLSDGGSKQPLLCHFASPALGEKSSDLVALAHTQMAHHISSGSQHPGFISAGSQSARQVSAKCAHNLQERKFAVVRKSALEHFALWADVGDPAMSRSAGLEEKIALCRPKLQFYANNNVLLCDISSF
jgi:hypothetical protein